MGRMLSAPWRGSLKIAQHFSAGTSLRRPRWGLSQTKTSAGMTLAYFIFGQRDSIGVVQNVLPLGLAGWNLVTDYRDRPA